MALARYRAAKRRNEGRKSPENELARLVPNLYELEYGRGETICREGESGDTFYVVWGGTVEIVAQGAGGEQTHVADLSAPAFVAQEQRREATNAAAREHAHSHAAA